MYIRSIKLRDWKAYVDATFEFPRPTKKKNVVLIGARNGYGKTSLLEALVIGLYGRDGLSIIARAVLNSGEQEKLAQSYDEFLQRALHARALEQGRSSASVTIVLEDGDDTITIQRTWHFSGGGRHRRDEEEVRIFQGPDQDPVRVPKFEDQDDFVRNYVAYQFLPVHLAQFFLFDGEQVQRLAKRDMSTQVKVGIEGILGVRTLRELQEDLREYARARRNSTTKIGDDTLDRLRAEVREIEARLKATELELADLEPKLAPLRSTRDRLVREIGSLHGGNSANLQELYDTKEKLGRERDRLRERLASLLRSDLALALCGSTLRSELRTRIAAEGERARWEAAKSQGAGGLDKVLTALSAEHPPLEPPLSQSQVDVLRARLIAAWETLWYPPPDNCAANYRHSYLGTSERGATIARLAKVDQLALGGLEELLTQVNDTDRDVRKVNGRIAQLSGNEDAVKHLAEEMDRVNKEEKELDARVRDLRRAVDGDRGQLGPKLQQLAKLTEGHQKAQPQLARAAAADKIADLVDGVVADSYPLHIDKVATEMTAAYQSLAHKRLVKQIEIAPDCQVRLVGDGGRDLRSMDASAGEDQIFALALIAAIARVSERDVPVVMDTPLARLDTEHRLNVLRYYAERAGEQVILLSQPDEVHGKYLDAIRDRVCKAYILDHEEIGNGVGVNRVKPGFFEEV